MANKSAYEIVSPIMNLFDCRKRFSKSFKLRSSCLAAPFTYKQKQKIREKTVKDEPKQSDNQKLVCKKKNLEVWPKLKTMSLSRHFRY